MDNARDHRNDGLEDLSFNMDFEAQQNTSEEGVMSLFGGKTCGGQSEDIGANFSFDF